MRRPVYDTVHVAAPFEDAATLLRQPPEQWLPPPAEVVDGGVVVTMRAAGLLATAGVDALVHVEPATLDQDGLLVRPIGWKALSADRAFPRLTAELELEAITDVTCRLTLVGGYQPPISVIGDTADRLVGRHIADAVVRMFLEGVTGALTTPVPPPTLRV
jgi:hypothetical protein